MSAPYGDGFTKFDQAQEPASSPVNHEAAADTGQPGLVAGIQRRQAERDRLLGLCQQLRQQHRCPGRCVFRGELGRSGLAGFRSMLDGRA